MSKRTNKVEPPLPPPYPMVIETFREPGTWAPSQFSQAEPSCFNRIVSVRRYRITVDLIDEPDSVIAARIKTLWEKSDNHHHMDPLVAAGRRYGITLDPATFGIKRGACK